MAYLACVRRLVVCLVIWLGFAGGLVALAAGEHRGQVMFGGLPVPGATVSASRQGQPPLRTITDAEGMYWFTSLGEGTWTVRVEMQLFSSAEKEISISSASADGLLRWELNLLAEAEIAKVVSAAPASETEAKSGATPAPNSTQEAGRTGNEVKAGVQVPAAADVEGEQRSDLFAEMRQRAADGLLINGTVNNGAATPFAQFAAFGNNRRGRSALYNGNLGVTMNHSVLDARSYSLSGQDTPKPAYTRVQGLLSFGGPLRIPHLLKHNGPNFTLNYQWMRNRNASTQAGLVPTLAERSGDLSQGRATALDPTTGIPFAGNIIPPSRISSQASALLALYPLPNRPGNGLYNYQVPLLRGWHQDDVQVRGNKQIGGKDFVAASFASQSVRTDSTNLFGFLDTGRTFGLNSAVQWRHSMGQRLYGTLEYRFTRRSDQTTPYFANRRNISGDAGITGNDQDPVNWGPTALVFASGIASLSDAQASLVRNQTGAVTYGAYWNRGRHNLQFGAGYGRQQSNVLAQQDARGTFTFTGRAAGSDFAGFLLGVPDASSIAFGNADKYLRSSSGNLYLTDDWRQSPGFTVNVGLRWEYWSPVTERYGRLVNLDISRGFERVAPVLGSQPYGLVSGAEYPASLLRPDRNGWAPRLAISWRPFPAHSMVVRAGYGIYYDTGVYRPIAMQMAQQAPLSKSLRVQNSPEFPLSLNDGFRRSGAITPTQFAVDPEFRVGYSQTWQVSVQRDLPWALQAVVSYTGTKGTRAQQQFLPNTYPVGASAPCNCPSGFTYLTSNGNSSYQAGQLQLRRRLRSGFAAQVQYTYSKSIDNATLGAAPGSVLIAQNWLDLRAERGLSAFDQRHVLSVQGQYTSGMGIHGGTLLSGWAGRLLKEWTVASQVTAGSGLPLTPVYLSTVPGTGVTDSLRPDYTGAPLYEASAAVFLNRAAFVLPPAGRWGNAGRNSITGPAQLSMTASLGRTFRSSDRISIDFRVDASNPLNLVTFPNWNTVVSSAQFGLPMTANPMRSLQSTVRLRF